MRPTHNLDIAVALAVFITVCFLIGVIIAVLCDNS